MPISLISIGASPTQGTAGDAVTVSVTLSYPGSDVVPGADPIAVAVADIIGRLGWTGTPVTATLAPAAAKAAIAGLGLMSEAMPETQPGEPATRRRRGSSSETSTTASSNDGATSSEASPSETGDAPLTRRRRGGASEPALSADAGAAPGDQSDPPTRRRRGSAPAETADATANSTSSDTAAAALSATSADLTIADVQKCASDTMQKLMDAGDKQEDASSSIQAILADVTGRPPGNVMVGDIQPGDRQKFLDECEKEVLAAQKA